MAKSNAGGGIHSNKLVRPGLRTGAPDRGVFPRTLRASAQARARMPPKAAIFRSGKSQWRRGRCRVS